MILLVDNDDSFVHNLARSLEELSRSTVVRRSRELTPARIRRLAPEALVISPGPCDPARAGVSVEAVRELSGEIPILGVCLGHQVIAFALGGKVSRAPEPVHGMTSPIHHDGRGIFLEIPSPFIAARYHSLAVEEEGLPVDLEVAAVTPGGRGGRVVMAVRHRRHPTFGLQFHPESILTEHGRRLLGNFLRLADDFHSGGGPPFEAPRR